MPFPLKKKDNKDKSAKEVSKGKFSYNPKEKVNTGPTKKFWSKFKEG